MKLTDTIGFINYETYLDNSDFHLSLPLESVYQLMTNCFAEDAGYSVDITISGKTMTLRFRAQINGFIMYDFPVHIKEKMITTEGQLTLNFNRMEERQTQLERMVQKWTTDAVASVDKRCNDAIASVDRQCNDAITSVDRQCNDAIASVDKRCNDTMVSVDKRCNDATSSIDNLLSSLQSRVSKLESIIVNAELNIRLNSAFVSLGTTSLTIPADNYLKLDKLMYLYNLQRLSFAPITLTDLSGCKHPHIKELYLDGGNTTHFRSLFGIANMPSIEHISIINAPGITSVSESLPSTHKIKSMCVKGCPGLNIEGLSIYCRVNRIALVAQSSKI
jgi:ribosome-associated translation inhibitor RaiA